MVSTKRLTAPDVKAGDRILFGKYSGSQVKLDDEEHLILREDDILGVLRANGIHGCANRYETFSVNPES
jgi:co-chaperonin GroES (HSP10)